MKNASRKQTTPAKRASVDDRINALKRRQEKLEIQKKILELRKQQKALK